MWTFVLIWTLLLVVFCYLWHRLQTSNIVVPETAEVHYSELSEKQLLKELDMKLTVD